MKLKRKWLLAIALVLSLTMATGGTLAYLTDRDTVENTFTMGNVDIMVEENFEQDSPLNPGVEVDKEAGIKNTHATESAYVWMVVSVPDALAQHIELDWAEGYTDTTVTSPHDGYTGYLVKYPSELAAGSSTGNILESVKLAENVDYQDGQYVAVSGGQTTPIGNLSNVSIMVDGFAIQTEGFDGVDAAYDAYTAQWDGLTGGASNVTGGSGDNDPIEVPAEAVEVSTAEDLKTALTEGGDYVIDAPITVGENLTVSAYTSLYSTDANNVVSFENNSKITVNEDQSLALYGVQLDGKGTYSFDENGSIVYDENARRTTPLLNVSAGATLTLGTQTNIENVVAQGSAVISAKGTAENRAKVVLEHASITNCAGESGAVINVDHAGDVVIGEGTVISNNASYNNNNHGIIRVYNAWDAANPSTVTMNGGEISNNYYSGNGMIGLYYGKMTMNGGEICGNSWFEDNQKNNGFYPVVYVHSNSQFNMNGGEISGNSVRYGALNCLNSAIEPAIIINGGTVTNNTNTDNNTDAFAAALIEDEGKILKSVSVSENANVTGTVWDYYKGYYTLEDYFAETNDL